MDLFARSYDALGFWAQLDAFTGLPLWAQLQEILEQGSRGDQRGFDAAVPDGFLPVWAPQQVRTPRLGEAWDLRDFDTRFAVPPNLRLEAEEEEINLGDELRQRDEGFRKDIDPRSPSLFKFRMPVADEIGSVEMTVEGFGAMRWQNPPHENVVIRANDSRTICFSEDREGCQRSRRGDVLIVAVAGTTDSHIEFSTACGGVGHEAPEDAIRGCLEARLGVGVGDAYSGDCGGRSEFAVFCSQRRAAQGTQRTYVVRADDCDIFLLLDERDSTWIAIDLVSVGHSSAGCSLPSPPSAWP